MDEEDNTDDVDVRLLNMVVSDSEDELVMGDGEKLIAPSPEDDSVDIGGDPVHNPPPMPPLKHYSCGLMCCRPKWLQVFANKKVFTVILFLFAVVESSIVSGFTSIVLSSLEKRYQFSSTAAGAIAISYDTVSIFTAIVISFLGGRPNAHKPRWLGGCLILMGTGAFIFASPQFLFGSYEIGHVTDSALEVCEDNRNITANCGPSNNLAYTIYIIGNVFVASGAASLYTIGPAFIDEIVFPKYVSLHIGVYHLGGLVGPGFGYIVGSLFLLIYVDPWVDTPLVPSDPAWVGGWWMGFILAGILSVLLSLLFFMYPKRLSDSHLVKIAREKEMVMKYTYTINELSRDRLHIAIWEILKSLCTHLKKLLFNKSLMFQNLSVSILFIVVAGLASFGPQYLETQLHLTASTSGLLSGGLSILAASTGVFVGAIVVHKAELKGRKLALFIAIILSIIVVPSPALLMYCRNRDIAGINTPYINSSVINGIDGSSCNVGCHCQSSVYEPVCGNDGITYFSPCRAGCRTHGANNDNFTNCSCIADALYHRADDSSIHYSSILAYNSTASMGACEISCITPGFVIIGVAMATIFLAFVAQVPVIYFTMRVVADEERSLALGIQSSMSRIFGSIPGPLLFGAVFDSSCVKWQDVCNERGNCWIYDNVILSRRVLYLSLPSLLLAVVFSYLSWYFHPKATTPQSPQSTSKNEHK